MTPVYDRLCGRFDSENFHLLYLIKNYTQIHLTLLLSLQGKFPGSKKNINSIVIHAILER